MLIFCIARVSRDGRDLVVLSRQHHVIFIRGFERVCRGETTFEQAGLVLGIQPEAMCYDLGFEEGRVCVATVRISQALLVVSGVYVGLQLQGLYVFTFRTGLLAQAAFVRPSNTLVQSWPARCIQVTNDRLYLTWDDSSRRQDIPMFEDAANAQDLPPPITPIHDIDIVVMEHWNGQGGYSFTRLVS